MPENMNYQGDLGGQFNDANTPQSMPISQPPAKKSSTLLIAIIAIVVILLGGGAYAAYYYNIWPFALFGGNASKQVALSNAINNLDQITSSRYQNNLHMFLESRDQNRLSFDDLFSAETQARELKFKRDHDKFRALQNVLGKLKSSRNSVGDINYPPDLKSVLGVEAPEYMSYNQLADGKDFELVTTFELAEAAEAVKNSLPAATISDVSVTINAATIASRSYFSFYMYDQPGSLLDEFVGSSDEIFDIIPSEFDVVVSSSGTSETASDDTTDSEFQAGATVSFGDFNIAADIEFTKKADDYYFRINKFPSLFFDLGAIKNNWVKITQDDIVSTSNFFLSDVSYLGDQSDKSKEIVDQLRYVMTAAFDEKALDIDYSLPDRLINDTEHYMYAVRLNQAGLLPWYEKVTSQLEVDYGEDAIWKKDQTVTDFLMSPELERYVAYLNSNAEFLIAVDPSNSYIDYTQFSLRLVPGSGSNMADKQVAITVETTLTDINKNITVEAPADAMSFDQAMQALTGMTEEDMMFQRQSGNIKAVRTALSRYYTHSGTYPTSLQALTMKASEVPKKATPNPAPTSGGGVSIDFPSEFAGLSGSDYPYSGDVDAPFISKVPKDVFTGQEYAYSATADSYSLIYDMAKTTRSVSPTTSNYIFGAMITVNDIVQFVNGQNTATPTTLSVEGSAAIKIDTDKDGLPDIVEDYYGSDINKTDSDGDGFSDGEEVKNSFDPNGPGKLDYSQVWYGAYDIDFPDLGDF